MNRSNFCTKKYQYIHSKAINIYYKFYLKNKNIEDINAGKRMLISHINKVHDIVNKYFKSYMSNINFYIQNIINLNNLCKMIMDKFPNKYYFRSINNIQNYKKYNCHQIIDKLNNFKDIQSILSYYSKISNKKKPGILLNIISDLKNNHLHSFCIFSTIINTKYMETGISNIFWSISLQNSLKGIEKHI